ncbi:MAG: hypothetical protein ACRELV_16800 [Longimicrobiales bacterium]
MTGTPDPDSPHEHDPADERDLLGEVERRARETGAGEPDEDEAPNLVRELLLDPDADPERGRDVTLGGYITKHDRPPAFEGEDGRPYTVATDAEETGDPAHAFEGFLVFIRWADTGAGIMGHIDSAVLTHAGTYDDAVAALLDLSLFEVKDALDDAIRRHASDPEEP